MNIWKYLREKQIFKYFCAYLFFILMNYILCLAPIGVSYYFSTQTLLLSSFLAYCFTLLAVTVYSFIFFPKESVGGTIVANLAIGITVLFMIIYIVLFILYNLVTSVANVLNTSMVKTASLAFIPAFVISLGLVVPVIRAQVIADKPNQVYKTVREGETKGDEVITTINREGI